MDSLPRPEPISPGIWRLTIPVPVALKNVNSYWFSGPDGWAVIDTGFHTPLAEQVWLHAIAAMGLRPADITQILITHHHPDHIGCAGWLQQLTGAEVLMFEATGQVAQRTWYSGTGRPAQVVRYLQQHGMPDEVGSSVRSHMEDTIRMANPRPTWRTYQEGETVTLGGRRFEPIWTPGHSEDHCCLWDAEHRLFVAGDHILAQITPNISFWPGGPTNPLADFLASLDKVAGLPAALTLTGHRHAIIDLQGRIAELQAHHAARLAEMEALAGRGATAWEIAREMFAPRLTDANNRRFALLETLAHLQYLHSRGRLQVDATPPVRWAIAQ